MEISIKAQQLFSVGGLNITNAFLVALIASFLLIIFAIVLRSKIKLIPGKLQSVAEMGIEALLKLMESVLGSMTAAEKYLPLIATLFIFILVSNLLGIIPGDIDSLLLHGEGGHGVMLFRAPAADLNFTLALAIISVLVTNIIGMAATGVFKHLSKYINFKGPIEFFVGILELISEFAKVISLTFRLFGNIFAGEVLIMIIFFLVPYVIPLPFIGLEFFVALIQAFIFTMITLVSISLHTTVHEEH